MKMDWRVRNLTIVGAAALFACGIILGQAQNGPAPAADGKAGGNGRGGGRGKGGGQAKSDWPPEGPTPRTADGKPDLSGNWTPNAIRQNVDMVGSGVDVPLLPGPAALYKQRKDALGKDDPEARCLPPGVPRMSTTPYPWTFIQTPQMLAVLYEGGAHVWRKIFLDGRPHDPRVVETWLGDSTGHWEGDTLVVETVGQNDITWLDESGLPHSKDMKVIERIKRPDLGHLEIEHTIDDPKTFSRPWTFTTHPSLLKGELIEYICQENNRDVEHLLGK